MEKKIRTEGFGKDVVAKKENRRRQSGKNFAEGWRSRIVRQTR